MRSELNHQVSDQTFSDSFQFLPKGKDLIAEGNFGTLVRKAINKQTGEEVAVKCIRLDMLTDKLQEAAKREREVLKLVRHSCILKTYCSYREKNQIYIVSELIRGGDLFDLLQHKGTFSERETRRVLGALSVCVHYLHEELQVLHRDLKLENILLRDADDCASVVLIDFGFARKIKEGGCRTDCGTRNYSSPEMLLGRSYGKSVDMWALGITTFLLLCGYHPFDTGQPHLLFSNICNGQILYDVEDAPTLSPLAKSCVESMLCVDTTQRIRISELMESEWLVNDC